MERTIGSLSKQLEEARAPKSDDSQPGANEHQSDLEAARAEIKAMRAEIEAKAEATRNKTRKHLVVAEFQAKGLDAIAAEEAYISMNAHEGDKLKLRDDETGVDYVKGEFDDPVPISSFVDTFLSSDRGRLYAPRKQNPRANGRANGSEAPGSKYITSEQMKTLSTEELKSGNYVLKE
jgi:hypothetical protein